MFGIFVPYQWYHDHNQSQDGIIFAVVSIISKYFNNEFQCVISKIFKTLVLDIFPIYGQLPMFEALVRLFGGAILISGSCFVVLAFVMKYSPIIVFVAIFIQGLTEVCAFSMFCILYNLLYTVF